MLNNMAHLIPCCLCKLTPGFPGEVNRFLTLQSAGMVDVQVDGSDQVCVLPFSKSLMIVGLK